MIYRHITCIFIFFFHTEKNEVKRGVFTVMVVEIPFQLKFLLELDDPNFVGLKPEKFYYAA